MSAAVKPSILRHRLDCGLRAVPSWRRGRVAANIVAGFVCTLIVVNRGVPVNNEAIIANCARPFFPIKIEGFSLERNYERCFSAGCIE